MGATRAFPAGLQLPAHKRDAMAAPLASAAAPERVVLALDQGDGRVATPVVRAGDRVKLGSVIAVDADSRAAVLHASVAGIVTDVGAWPPAGPGESVACVSIANDGSEERDATLLPITNAEDLPPEELLAHIANSGIVGLGGAAFPTAIKLASARAGGATHLVLNGAECEPWICCDDALMRERPARVLLGARLLLRITGATRCTIAVEDDKPEAIEALRTALAAQPDPRIDVQVLPTVYPSGAERQLLDAVTGVEVPSGRPPSEVGVLCHNVGTAAALADFVLTGEPCLRRIVTLTGSGLARPGNVEARIGTPLADLVQQRGGYVGTPLRLIAGGTLTGRTLPSDAPGLTKAMNCIIVATAQDLAARGPERPCIRCGDCATVCPAGLLPQQLHRYAVVGDPVELQRHGLLDCIECGCCDYVCPSQIPLTERFHNARALLERDRDEARRALEARGRYERHQVRLQRAEEAERLAFDEARRRARDPDAPGA